MASKWWLLVVGVLMGTAQAESLLLQGTIGRAAVVLELDIGADGLVDGRYFYRKYQQDIEISGQRQADGSLLLEENSGDAGQRSELTLRPQGPGWQGKWQRVKARTALPIALSPLAAAKLAPSHDPALQPFRQSSPYDYERMAAMKLQPGKYERFQGYTLQWWLEPESQVRFFRLKDGFDAATLQRLNQRLAQRQWQEVADYFNCQLVGNRLSAGAYFEHAVTPKLINRRLLSVSVLTGYYCGGLHPDDVEAPLNLDVETGRELQLEDLLWLGKGKPQLPRQADGEREDYQYEHKLLAPWLQRQFARLYPGEFAAAGEGECDYRSPEVWQFVSWYAEPKGLYIGPSFPRVERGCEDPEWSVLPWSLVRQHPGAAAHLLP